jgi:hypothetical protein
MSGMGWFFSTYIEGIMKAYGLNQKEAYIYAGKRSKGYIDGYLIKNDDAHAVVELMETYAKDGAVDFGDMLRGTIGEG